MHYVCIHGVCHGGWCWGAMRADLEALGHTVTTPDLPLTGIEDDAEAVQAILDGLAEPCVLVGHSYGGAVISKAAAGREDDVAHLVYVAAVMLGATENINDASQSYPVELMQHLVVSEEGRFTVDPQGAISVFYEHCDQELAVKAAAQLRWTSMACLTTPAGAEPWHSIPSTYVICQQDKAVSPVLQAIMAKRAASTVVLDTDHSPFYSSPDELVSILLEAS